MSTTQEFHKAAMIYRESPNTFGHEDVDCPRAILKRMLSLVASQRMLQASIADARTAQYCDESLGVKHLWCRLKEVEDQLRELEAQYGEAIKSKEYLTY